MLLQLYHHYFWPSLREENSKLHPSIQKTLDLYKVEYEAFKASRKLTWKPFLGSIQLELELGDRTIPLSVSPIQASIILFFQDTDTWNIEELAQKMEIPVDSLRKKLAIWINNGIITESRKDVYQLIESKSMATNQGDIIIEEEEQSHSKASSQQEQLWQKVEQLLIGMLTNFDKMPLDRIYTMLMMCLQDDGFTKTQSEMGQYLDKLVKDDILDSYPDGFSLKKK